MKINIPKISFNKTTYRLPVNSISNFTIITAILFSFSVSKAQNVASSLQSLTQSAAQEYAQPLVNAIGANLNTGWMTKAPDAEILGLDIRFGLVGMGAFIDPEDEVFQLLNSVFQFQEDEAKVIAGNAIPGFNVSGVFTDEEKNDIILAISQTEFTANISGPTVFGDENTNLEIQTETQLIEANGTTFSIGPQTVILGDVGGLINTGLFPTAAPQATIGTVQGTQATFRYLPSLTLDDQVGSLEYIGFGIQHNPAVWFSNPLPLNIGLSYFTQSLKIGSVLDINTTAFGIQVSKTISGVIASITPYAGFLIEDSKMDVDYEYEISPGVTSQIQFELDGENSNRLIIGTGASLFGLNLFADYNFASVNTVNVSLMYSF